MNILNLYAGIGGNRRLWEDVQVTAVEKDPEIARIYKELFPEDIVIVGDAHEYLLEHYQEFDLIWSSPPCPTHGQYRYNVGVRGKGFDGLYPDMKLYEEIIFLKYHCKTNYVVENVVSYYEPLIKPQKLARHYFWSNILIPDIKVEKSGIRDKNKIQDLEQSLGYDLSKYKIPNKRQILRNCVNSDLGNHILKEIITQSIKTI